MNTQYHEVLDTETVLSLKFSAQELYDACLLLYYAEEGDEFNKNYYTKKVVTFANKIIQTMEEQQ